MKRSRIVVADDHTMVSDAIKNLLEQEFEVVGTFADGQSLLEAVQLLMPDVIVLDIGMPVMNGLNAGQRIKQVRPRIKLIYLTMNQDPDLAAEAFRWGASGYLLKTSAASELVKAIREVLRGGSYVTPLMTKNMVGSYIQNFKRQAPAHKLTLRQREVLQLLVEGRPMKEVAYILNITPRTVAFHKYMMMEQLKVKSSAELIQYAIKNSIVSPLDGGHAPLRQEHPS
jgi:DNA-binding NarL/FixJ family response regulator